MVSFYKIKLSNLPNDTEVIAGSNSMINYMFTQIEGDKRFIITKATKEEATDHIKAHGFVGAGLFIHNPHNIVDNENRRIRAKDLLVYLGTRIGFGVMWEPVEIQSVNLETDRESIKANNVHLAKYI